jgi:hypothetical protein
LVRLQFRCDAQFLWARRLAAFPRLIFVDRGPSKSLLKLV